MTADIIYNPVQPAPLAPSHLIKAISTLRIPSRHICLDTEAYRERDPDEPGTETQRFRLAVASMMTFPTDEPYRERFVNSRDLWWWVNAFCRVRQQTILWCHNLSYDVRIADAFRRLPEIGWSCEMMRVDDDMAWAKWRRVDGASLVMCDTVSWVPTSLDRIGAMLGMSKPSLPDDEDDDETWFERCESDVDILSAAVWHILSWLAAEDVGPWRATGASAGFAAFKYGFLSHRILSHDDLDARVAERWAAYCGRCEPWSLGRVHDVYEWDFSHAYAGIARDYPVPTRLLDECRFIPRDTETTALVWAEVDVPDGSLPVLPYRDGHDAPITWPVGRFTGWWWSEELHAAEMFGARVQWKRRIRYALEPALQSWAEWIIDVIDHHESPLVSLVAKQWARTLVGRFGLRYPVWQAAEEVDGIDLYAGWWVDGEGFEAPRRMMRIANRMYVADRMQDGHDSCPQIMSYVMMRTRLRLLDAMLKAGIESVHYMDTDGLLVDRSGHRRLLDRMIPDLRYKSHFDNVDILGTKQIVLDDTPRVAGLPSRARKRNPDGSYDVEVWERFRGALETGHIDTVRVRTASWHVAPSPDGRRWSDPTSPGRTIPPHIGR